MDRKTTRRGALAALLAGGVGLAGLSSARTFLERFAPLSGEAWDAARRSLPDRVESPYGEATLRYDDDGVTHVEGNNERACYFAIGYAQASDRLFQMDLQRRVMRGELSAVFGERAIEVDRFHVRMDFAGAAEATRETLRGTEAERLTEAYAEGVNRYRHDGPAPFEFTLLGYEAEPWTVTDTLLAEKQIAWNLTGSFRTLRKETLAAELEADVAETVLPDRLEHDAQIVGHEPGTGHSDSPTPEAAANVLHKPRGSEPRATAPELESWLANVEPADGLGSNSWVISGKHTDDGAPIVANDPHLSLMAPPVWYEQHVVAPDYDVRGVTFPGVPFVVIGENQAGAWGFTNAGCDVIDFYEYDTRADGQQYQYGEQWRTFDREPHTITVADGEDRNVTVKKSVHGAVLDAESDGDELRSEVGVAWTGLSATRTTEAVYDLNRSTGLDDVRAALKTFDEPTQNFVYADREGRTLYRTTGKVPIRRTDGDAVPGNRVFDGSAREGEWTGWAPYGESDWDGEGFIPFEEMPEAIDVGHLGTANQRIVNDADYPYYFAEAYSSPFRGMRLWERLDERVAGDSPVTPEFMREVQRDAYDKRAELFVPILVNARSGLDERGREAVDTLDGWDYRMRREARAALVFARFIDHYAEIAWRERLSELGERRDPSEYYGNDWALLALPDDWFVDSRETVIGKALNRALDELADEGWQRYGDYNQTRIDHPFDRSWLNYSRLPTDGSPATLNNFRVESAAGSSWRQVCPTQRESTCILPGGNDGSVFSNHYADQLRRWAGGSYKPMATTLPNTVTTRFEGEGS